ncbi:16S rRNA (cytidine(1402)-2'-O)-methyltransferase [Alginatibacterium sediminis]|uniref:Ribosomal RNA small subunit methyltransferase I n=1 Tax=Alginatibacterium sediminis TaxID=2164068 RepID=A0A420E8W6_9ALTE|nr:16S rRNA (cytidine(1402)-2'-O)-methyltransferase [Alginatibacterium sediminis]RKF15896.1 16S rRNA (cytidine(1402)-2'-O)-methyltransferase [Alginatibacterium sediminis]
MMTQAALYIVPTPIGNLGDMTLRAIEVLKQVSVIAAEDTRNSRRLMQHFDIDTPLVAVHDHNEQQRCQWLGEQLTQGKSVALISDAGTPLINDPGYHLVAYCQQQGFDVVPLPGACAAIAALSASGLPTDRFSYEGFLPAKTKARCDRLNDLADASHTMVFYESPHRILDSLTDIETCMGAQRRIVMAREITKTFESILSMSVHELRQRLIDEPRHQKGEMVLVVAGKPKQKEALPKPALQTLALLRKELPLKKAAALTAQIYDLKKNALYQYGLEQEKSDQAGE